MQAPPSYAEAISHPSIPNVDPSMSPASPPDYTRFAPPIPRSPRPLTPPLPSPVRIDITSTPTTDTAQTRTNQIGDRSNKDYSDWKLMCKCLGYTILFLLIITCSVIEIIIEEH